MPIFALAALLVAGFLAPPPVTSNSVSDHSVSRVVKAATAFARSLTDDQKSRALLDFDESTATAWSDQPCGEACRGGVPLAELSSRQRALAETLLRTALDSSPTSGYGRIEGIRAANEALGEPEVDLALLGTPSNRKAWQLHFGASQLAVNFTYDKGKVVGSTPYFAGLEPASHLVDGRDDAALADMATAIRTVTYSLDTSQLTKARLDQDFSGVVLGPGHDAFPAKKQGIRVGALRRDQRKLVLNAIARWVGVTDPATHRRVMRSYEKDLARTYIGWSGETDLARPGDYFRIDGPGVWIEFACEDAVDVPD